MKLILKALIHFSKRTALKIGINANVCILSFILLGSMAATGCGPDTSSGKKAKVYGTISVSGSSTMSNLISIWCKGFSDIYHNTNCVVESFGSSKAPKDLIDGKVDIGSMSEPMSNADKQAFKNKYGYDPIEVKIAIDMIAVLVNAENPIECITLEQLDGIYSSAYKCQGSLNISTWGELDLDGEWGNVPINAYGRTPTSGTYDVFKNIALCGGTYKDTITELASSRDIVDFVTRDTASIGYTGAGLLAPNVSALKIGDSLNNCYAPIPQNAISKQYPLTRDLYLYLRDNPSNGMKNATRLFLDYVLSNRGQEAITEAGLIRLPQDILRNQKAKLAK